MRERCLSYAIEVERRRGGDKLVKRRVRLERVWVADDTLTDTRHCPREHFFIIESFSSILRKNVLNVKISTNRHNKRTLECPNLNMIIDYFFFDKSKMLTRFFNSLSPSRIFNLTKTKRIFQIYAKIQILLLLEYVELNDPTGVVIFLDSDCSHSRFEFKLQGNNEKKYTLYIQSH